MTLVGTRAEHRARKLQEVAATSTPKVDSKAGFVLDLLDEPIRFHRRFIDLTGTVTSALLLSYACYTSQDNHDEHEGWFLKSREEWTVETGLSPTEQRSAIKRLQELEVLEVIRHGMPAKTWYRVSFDKLHQRMIRLAEARWGHQAVLIAHTDPTGIGH